MVCVRMVRVVGVRVMRMVRTMRVVRVFTGFLKNAGDETPRALFTRWSPCRQQWPTQAPAPARAQLSPQPSSPAQALQNNRGPRGTTKQWRTTTCPARAQLSTELIATRTKHTRTGMTTPSTLSTGRAQEVQQAQLEAEHKQVTVDLVCRQPPAPLSAASLRACPAHQADSPHRAAAVAVGVRAADLASSIYLPPLHAHQAD